jgi:long-subunit acyl-CoA synthetase (AMP-forming)
MRECGVAKGDVVAIYSKNRPEWTISAAACDAFSNPSVALYDTLGPSAVQVISTCTIAPPPHRDSSPDSCQSCLT